MMSPGRIALVLAVCMAVVPGWGSPAGATEWDDLGEAWLNGDIPAARAALAGLDEAQLATPAGLAWTLRLADVPARHDLLRSDVPADHLDAAWIAWGRGDHEDAASHLATVRTADGGRLPGVDFLTGLLARRAGDTPAARSALASVRPDDPSFAWARYTLGRIAAAEGDAALARRYYDNADKAAAPVCRADVLAATWELVRGPDPRQALRLERELANRFPESLPLIRVRELARRRQAVETIETSRSAASDPAAPAAAVVPAPREGRFTLQIAAFTDRGRALAFRDEWSAALGELDIVSGSNAEGKSVHRVRTGRFPTRQQAAARSEELLRDHGLTCLVVEREPGS